MFTETAGRIVWAVVAVMFGYFAGISFAADEAKSLGLPKALAQVKLLANLTEAEREAMRGAATLRRGTAGERIVEQGKAQDRMYIILGGEAEVKVDGKHVVTYSGQVLVGEIEFLDMLPACADVILLKETDLIELNHAALIGLMERQPRLGYVLMREIARIEARRLRDTAAK